MSELLYHAALALGMFSVFMSGAAFEDRSDRISAVLAVLGVALVVGSYLFA